MVAGLLGVLLFAAAERTCFEYALVAEGRFDVGLPGDRVRGLGVVRSLGFHAGPGPVNVRQL